MLILIAVHFGVAALTPLLVRWFRRHVFFALALPPAVTCCWLLGQLSSIAHGQKVSSGWTWIGDLGIELSTSVGPLQWLLGMVISGIGALVLLYCRWYFAGEIPIRTAAILVAFAGAMLGLVSSDNVIMIYVFWELTTVFSYLLVGHNPTNAANRRAAMTALIVTTFGGLAMLAGVLILGNIAGSYQLGSILAAAPSGPGVTTAIVLLLVGAVSKSALVPFHFWLPAAMAAPTPVSAYLHAAAMVKAGVYLVALLAPGFADDPLWRPVLLTLGACTMLLGGWRALRQHDIKLLLAFGTVSQLGFMITVAGLGTTSAALAACAVLGAHALFKSALFMIVGIVDHHAGTRDLRELSGIGRRQPILAAISILAAASMAGIPPTFGFVAKEGALGALVRAAATGGGTGLPRSAAIPVLAAIVAGSVLTVGYSLRFVWGAFASKRQRRWPLDRRDHNDGGAVLPQPLSPTPFQRVEFGFWLIPAIPAVAGLILGFTASPVGELLQRYARTMHTGAPAELTLWHGLTPQLGLSVLAIVLGVLLFMGRRRFAALQAVLGWPVEADSVYQKIMRGIDRIAVETTAMSQRGSLPLYLGVIALVVVVLPGSVLVRFQSWPQHWTWFDDPAQPVVGALIIAAAVLAGKARGRIKAVLLAGGTGYGAALLFLLHGAPDLALTQVLVETVTLIVLTLVFRRLDPYFSDQPLPPSRWWRAVLAIGVGAVAALSGFVALGNRTAQPVSSAYRKVAPEFGYGNNIVNVTLVDTRAWDTLGEISVLMVAATGVASLIFLSTRNPGLPHPLRAEGPARPDPTGDGRRLTWLRGGKALSPLSRSIVFEVMTRLLFPIMILVSVYLLLTGHNSPGGGFAAGLITGLALMIRYLAAGPTELNEAAPVDAGRVLGAGLVVSVGSAIAPLLFGGQILESYRLDIHPGPPLSGFDTDWGHVTVLGDIHLVTSMFFDIGVFLVVVGVLLDLVRSLGAGIDRRAQQRTPEQPDAVGARR